jgi:hypothetical protein
MMNEFTIDHELNHMKFDDSHDMFKRMDVNNNEDSFFGQRLFAIP